MSHEECPYNIHMFMAILWYAFVSMAVAFHTKNVSIQSDLFVVVTR